MIWFKVAYIALSCPGGMLKGMIPASLRPVICEARPYAELFSSEKEALGLIRREGRSAQLEVCEEAKGTMKCRPTEVGWEPFVKEE